MGNYVIIIINYYNENVMCNFSYFLRIFTHCLKYPNSFNL